MTAVPRTAMAISDIVVQGAREHNLCSIDLVLPRNKLICLTGVSGSGKSSLAFDTLYAEGQRRYVESLSNFARQFLGQMPKPDVDSISGLSPSISISQKTSGNNPRSTVGTITEIYDYLRVLFARVAQGHCPSCRRPLAAQSREQILATICSLPRGAPFSVLAPVVRQQKGEFHDLFADLRKQGFVRARVDGMLVPLTANLQLKRQMRHNIDVVVDRLVVSPQIRHRLAEAVETALKLGQGNLVVTLKEEVAPTTTQRKPGHHLPGNPGDLQLSADYACSDCGLNFEQPTPQLFSFNSPQGMCLECDGLGEFFSFDPERLVTRPDWSFQQGCIELVGKLKDLGRWRRHILQGVATTMERKLKLDPGTLLETPWEKMDPSHQQIWLWGTGEEHITFTWRHGSASHKHGGEFEGLIPEFVAKYGSSKTKSQIRQLEKYMNVICCPDCQGERLNPQARAVMIRSTHPKFIRKPKCSLPEICHLPITDAINFFSQITLDETQAVIAVEILKELNGRLKFLQNVGLDYLSLDRRAPTLSGGESQRIRLAGQIGCGLVGVLYILDEPSIGLHPRDNGRLLDSLKQLRDLGNTVIVVEHDEETMRAADYVVDFGPGPGIRGGKVVATGNAAALARQPKSLTGQFLAGKEKISVPVHRRPPSQNRLRILGAAHNNLQDIDVEIPIGSLVCVTGVSGSGKSSLVNDILVEALRRDLNGGKGNPGYHRRITGMQHLDKLIAIDQSPIGRTPRSNPGTYIKVFDDIRSLYAQLPEAKRRGYRPGRFSFNVRGGRCEACEGNGSNRLEMDFLADVWITCPVCDGHRFNKETFLIHFKGKSISDVLEMDVQEALQHFENIPSINHKLETLCRVGLDYLKLGQPSPTLSGGEAQRIKLARELVKKSTGKTLYLLDEPTTGLHFADIRMLLSVLCDFVSAGNTVLVVEHNLDVIKTADWIIDLGPEGGADGGRLVATGTPEEVAANRSSYTGRALAQHLKITTSPPSQRSVKSPRRKRSPAALQQLKIQGAAQHNLKELHVSIPREKMTVFCGPSGSGKTSLAMDTIYAEGQRRYVQSLSVYARQFVGQMQKPRLEHIEGLSPSIAIQQRNMGHTPRSTIGTVTEVYDYLRILFARLGQPMCPDCDVPVGTQTSEEIIDKLLAEPQDTKIYLMAPVEIELGVPYESLWKEIRSAGYVRMRVDDQLVSLESPPHLDHRRQHRVEVIVDRLKIRPHSRSRIAESVEAALALGKGLLHVVYPKDDLVNTKWPERVHSQHLACEQCGRSFQLLTPHNFSFNSPLGWCRACEGLGTQTGTNPAALIKDTQLTLVQGAILLWPDVKEDVFCAMLDALSQQTGIPKDVSYEKLSANQRRLLLYGTGDEWFAVIRPGKRSKKTPPWFRFQYKGLYPALEEAVRVSPSMRRKLEHLVDKIQCSECGGSRLRDDASATQFRDTTIDDLSRLPLGDLAKKIQAWRLTPIEKKVAGHLLSEIGNRLSFLVEVGLGYLTLARQAMTLSGGESQRIRLASQIGSGLCGVLYVLDEPTIGLHPRDNQRLIKALKQLRDLGNTLLVVEHDRDVLNSADHMLDFGPGAGRHGGHIVAQGHPDQAAKRRASVTGPFLSGKKAIPIPTNRRVIYRNLAEKNRKTGKRSVTPDRSTAHGKILGGGWLEIIGARHNNLCDVRAAIPLETLTVVTGPSGSGKSSLIFDVLYKQLARSLHQARTVPGIHQEIHGIEQINKVIRVDQHPLGNSPASNAATYTGVFDLIRTLFSQLPESKVRGFSPRRFSFNAAGGRCDHCEGDGQLCVEMHFLPDVWVECPTCRGQRYNPETLAVKYRGRSISDLLQMSCSEATKLFENIPKVHRILQVLCDVGLDYLSLGQPAPRLSGGEAQRVKLAAELGRPDTGRTLYLLDEPTTGLHFEDLSRLLDVLNRLVDVGNTVVVIEHNLDVIKTADWVIDLGPEAGDAGGEIVVVGTPEDLADYAQRISSDREKRPAQDSAHHQTPAMNNARPLRSYTGEALSPILATGPHRPRQVYKATRENATQSRNLDLSEVGEQVKMPWENDGRLWHIQNHMSRHGKPCRWDGRILDRLEKRIHRLGKFRPTHWNSRTVVEISAPRKGDGWFFHAITNETWLLKLKFRTAKKTFQRETLISQLAIKPLNEMDDLPIYGRRSRVRCKNLRGPWQEIQLDIHSFVEINTAEFWTFLETAVSGFSQLVERLKEKPQTIMPWTVMGQKWHLSRKGFPLGKRVDWQTELLEELCELLSETAPQGQFLWNNQQVVHFMVREQKQPWAVVHTKRPAGLDLVLNGPKNQFSLGRVAQLGRSRKLETRYPDHDSLKFRFQQLDDLDQFNDFLKEHFSRVKNGNGS